MHEHQPIADEILHHHTVWSSDVFWVFGWLVAMAVLFWFAIRLPLQAGRSGLATLGFSVAVVTTYAGVLLLANAALEGHHLYFDLTREKVYTPSDKALEVARTLERPVNVTYFYRRDDERGRRAEKVVTLMGRLNPLLTVVTADPNKQPELARAVGAKAYNSAVVAAEGRRVIVRTVDETEIALAIQRVLRQHAVRVCFTSGHNEYPSDNYEFHTHVEGLAGHEHDSADSAVIQSTAHGIGRLRRALESIGYEVSVITPATDGRIPPGCRVVIAANPRTTFLPAESAMLKRYLEGGGALLAMFDLGFVLEPGLEKLFRDMGVSLPQAQVVDPKSHYATSPEMVAVTGYDRHPVTRSVAFTFYPGVRPLVLHETPQRIRTHALIASTATSTAKPVAGVTEREVAQPVSGRHTAEIDQAAKAHVLAAAVEGRLAPDSSRPFRAIVIGDGDFASNSFFPFMSNNQLAISMVRWLAREEKGTAIASRVRVPALILLTGAQMRAMFLLLVLGLPLAVLALGGMVWWWRR